MLGTKKIIKNPDVTFSEDMEDLEKCPSGRNEGLDHVVDSFSKSNQEEGIEDNLEDDDEQEEDLGDGEKHVKAPSAPSRSLKASKAKEVAPKPPQLAPSTQKEDQTLQESRYPSRVRKSLGEWWKNHILPNSCRSTKTQVNPSSALNRTKHHQSNPSNVPGILDSNLSGRACIHSSKILGNLL